MRLEIEKKTIETILILVFIIIAIIVIINKKRSTFWKNQPVMRVKNNKTGLIGIVPTFNIHLGDKKYSISSTESIGNIKKFVIDNFTSSYLINNKTLDYTLNRPSQKNICLTKNSEIIGLITSYPLKLYIDNNVNDFYYVDYLCVSNKHREQGIATILMSALLNQYRDPYLKMIFKKDGSQLPFKHIIKSSYYAKDLSRVKPVNNPNITRLDVFNFYKIFFYVNGLLSRHRVHKLYTKKEFYDLFIEKQLLELFIINTGSYDIIIIGKKTTYKVNKMSYICFDIDYILGDPNNNSIAMDGFIEYIKDKGYNYISIANLGFNKNT